MSGRKDRLKVWLTNPIGNSGYNFLEERQIEDLELWKDHRRLIVFYHKGLKCANPECNNIGTRLICGTDPGGGKHWDIYTDDLILMTVDHIIPKAKGGGEELENKNPMCRICNSAKSDKIEIVYLADGIIPPLSQILPKKKNKKNKNSSFVQKKIKERNLKNSL